MKKTDSASVITIITIYVVFAGCSLTKSNISGTKAKIDELLQAYDIPDAPGYSMAVIRNGHIFYQRSNGFSDLQKKQPASIHTNYRLASVTKQFTALAILQLNQAKLLAVDDHIQKYLPLPAYARDIKISHLLNHTSGLADYEKLIAGTTPVTDKNVLELLKNQDTLQFAAGSKYAYSNSGYSLLAMIIEKVSGQTYPQYIREHIFNPLKMDSSSFNVSTLHIPNRAYGYSKKDGAYEKTDQSTSSYVLGDGGIYSSVADMAKWQGALSAPVLIKKNVLQQAQQYYYELDSVNQYACGWRITKRNGIVCFNHSGGTRGFSTYHIYIPEKKTGVIFLTNRTGTQLDPTALSNKIIGLFL